MSQKNATEFCAVLLREIYGDISATVASVLLEYGRLNLLALVRYSRLSEKIVKQTLVVLIQLHLVVHYTHKESRGEEVYYECSWIKVYELLHAGRMVAVTEERFGPAGGYTIMNLLQFGHARISDFLISSGLPNKPSAATILNGKVNELVEPVNFSTPTTVGELKVVMEELLKGRWLVQVQEHHMHPHTDVVNEVRLKLQKQLKTGAMSELKLKKLVDAEMKAKLRDLEVGDITEHAGMKRRTAISENAKRPSKRQKVAVDDGFGSKEPEWEIDESIVIRVNHEKFLILFRNQELVTLVERRLGKATAQVYGELLKSLEDKTYRVQDEIESGDENGSTKKIKTSTLELSRSFCKDIELENSFAPLPKSNANGKKRRRGEDDLKSNGKVNGHRTKDNGDNEDESEEENEWSDGEEINPETAAKKKRMALIKEHLELLSQDSYGFVKQEGNRGLGEWSVDFRSLGDKLKQIEMEKIIGQRFGPVGVRLVRILQEKGKLDEKQLASIALRKSNSIRSTLSALQEAGHLELQEVPKSADRTASRTIFLWYYDPERATKNVLHDIYKAMSRALQRIRYERGEIHGLLEKAERTDIQGNEEVYLSKGEQRIIARFKIMEEKLLGQLHRLDRQVLIFRDL